MVFVFMGRIVKKLTDNGNLNVKLLYYLTLALIYRCRVKLLKALKGCEYHIFDGTISNGWHKSKEFCKIRGPHIEIDSHLMKIN